QVVVGRRHGAIGLAGQREEERPLLRLEFVDRRRRQTLQLCGRGRGSVEPAEDACREHREALGLAIVPRIEASREQLAARQRSVEIEAYEVATNRQQLVLDRPSAVAGAAVGGRGRGESRLDSGGAADAQ